MAEDHLAMLALAFEEGEAEPKREYLVNMVMQYEHISPGELEACFNRHRELSWMIATRTRTAVWT